MLSILSASRTRTISYLQTPKAVLLRVLTLAGFVTGFVAVSLLAMAPATAEPTVHRDIAYVDDGHELQTLDVYTVSDRQLPVVLYIHGGGWAFGDKEEVGGKPAFFNGQELAFVSINYRLRWEFKVLDQLEDVVSAIAWIKQHGAEHGLDPERIVLMGHAAGAHLAALVATNQNLLRVADLSLQDIDAVVAIDTQSYDIYGLMQDANFVVQRQHRLIFGNNEDVWQEYSPAHHIAPGKGHPAFAILYVAQEEGEDQAPLFARKLVAADVETLLIPGNAKTPASINDELGQAGDVPTQAVLAFIKAKL